MGFEVFDRQVAVAGDKEPRVFINPSGQIVLNAAAKAALDRLVSGSVLVELLYDRDLRQVGIRPLTTRTNARRGFAVSRASSAQWPRVIQSGEFVHYWRLPMGREQTFGAAVQTVGGKKALVFDLREPNGETMR